MNLDKWKSQIIRGTLEYCILLMLNHKTCYGYEILQKLSAHPVIASTESTVYPLLRRLQKEGYLDSAWQDSAEGLPPRKYYSLTPEGRACLQAMDEEWQNLLFAMSELKEGRNVEGKEPSTIDSSVCSNQTERSKNEHNI